MNFTPHLQNLKKKFTLPSPLPFLELLRYNLVRCDLRGKVTAKKVIYLLSSGNYSSYQIHSAYSTRALAKKALSKLNPVEKSWIGGGFSIESFPLDETPEKWIYTCVRMDKQGQVLETWGVVQSPSWPVSTPLFDQGHNLVCSILTESEERAVKSTNEVRSELLALDLWDKDKEVRAWFKRISKSFAS